MIPLFHSSFLQNPSMFGHPQGGTKSASPFPSQDRQELSALPLHSVWTENSPEMKGYRQEVTTQLASPKTLLDIPGILLIPKLHSNSPEGVCILWGHGERRKIPSGM